MRTISCIGCTTNKSHESNHKLSQNRSNLVPNHFAISCACFPLAGNLLRTTYTTSCRRCTTEKGIYCIYLNNSGYYSLQPPASAATIQGRLLYNGGSYFKDRAYVIRVIITIVYTTEQMRVVSSLFHQPLREFHVYRYAWSPHVGS